MGQMIRARTIELEMGMGSGDNIYNLDDLKKAVEEKHKELCVFELGEEAVELICRMTWLEDLLIGGCTFKRLPEAIGDLTRLKCLRISQCWVEYLPKSIGRLTGLRELELYRNAGITSIPEGIGALTELTELRINSLGISCLPESIGQLKRLRLLNLNDNKYLTSLPDSIGDLVALRELSLGGCNLYSLPESLGRLGELKELSLWSNSIKTLPQGLIQLPRLKELSCRGTLVDFPRGLEDEPLRVFLEFHKDDSGIRSEYYEHKTQHKFWEITLHGKHVILCFGSNTRKYTAKNPAEALKDFEQRVAKKLKEGYVLSRRDYSLHARADIMRAIEEKETSLNLEDVTDEMLLDICKIESLESLSVSSARFTTMPDEIANLTKLKSLSIDCRNAFCGLSPRIAELKALRELSISSALLEGPLDALGELSNLTSLRLGWNNIKELGDIFGNLDKLEHLDLANNNIRELPASLGRLSNLESLELSTNLLTRLPESIGGLASLETLEARNNRIEALPEGIGQLSELEELDLYENALTCLPASIGDLESLDDLDVSSNNLNLPKDVTETADILEYYTRGGGEADQAQALYSADAGLDPTEKAALLQRYAERLDAFAEENAGSGGSRRKRLDALLDFISAKTDVIPPARKNDYSDIEGLIELLAPIGEWCFIERRILRYMTQDDWYWKKGEYHRGFYNSFFEWVETQVEAQTGDVFARVHAELRAAGLEDERHIIELLVSELHKVIIDDKVRPSSVGEYLLSVYDEHLDFMLEVSAGYVYRYPLVGLFAKFKPESFDARLDELLKTEHGWGMPQVLGYLCEIDKEKYEPRVMKVFEQEALSPSRRAKIAQRILTSYGDKYRAQVLEACRDVISALKDIEVGGYDEYGYMFIWDEAWVDGRLPFMTWALERFKTQVMDVVFDYIESTKVLDLNLVEAVVSHLGQHAIGIVAEAHKMHDEGEKSVTYFERLFALTRPLDTSSYSDQIWKVAQFKSMAVKRLAAGALGKEGEPALQKALSLTDSDDVAERLAAVLVLQHFKDDEAVSRRLEDMKNTESDYTVRREVLACVAVELEDVKGHIERLKGTARFNKPVRKWLTEMDFPGLCWKDGAGEVDADSLRFVLYAQSQRDDVSLDTEVEVLLEAMDKGRSGEFANALLKRVEAREGMNAKSRFVLGVIGALGDKATLERFGDVAIRDKNLNAVKALGANSSNEALLALDKVIRAFVTKYPNVRTAAEQAFEDIARKRGASVMQLRDLIVPDFGFSGRYRPFDCAGAACKAFIDTDVSLKFINDKGKIVKTVPKAAGEQTKQIFKDIKKALGEAKKQQLANLQNNLIHQRQWKKEDWEAVFLNNPLMHALGRALVWGVYEQGRLQTCFRITEHITFVNEEGQAINLQGKNWESDFWNFIGIHSPKPYEKRGRDRALTIGLVHPLSLSDERREKWKAILAQEALRQPIAQLERKVFRKDTDALSRRLHTDFEGRAIERFTFDTLGWRRGSVVDAGEVSGYKKTFVQEGIEVFVMLEGVNVQFHEGGGRLKRFYFVRADSVYTGSYFYDEPADDTDSRLIALEDVPDILYSEVVSDLSRIAGEA